MLPDKTNNTLTGVNKEAVSGDYSVNEPNFTWPDIHVEFCKEPHAEESLSDDELISLLIDRQTEQEGTIPADPCAEAMELLEHWSSKTDSDWIRMWREDVDHRKFDANWDLLDRSERLNDALILGESTPAFKKVMQRPITFLTGYVWDEEENKKRKRRKKNTLDGNWRSVTMPGIDHILGFEGDGFNTPTYGLSRNPIGYQKDGFSFVCGSSRKGQRKAKAMDTMFAIGLDIDSGASLESVLNRILRLGLAACVYPSWNHKKRGLVLKRDDVLKKLKIETDPTLEQVQEYLRQHSKSRFEEAFINAVAFDEGHKDWTEIALDTTEIDKFRVVFFLAEPVSFEKLTRELGTHSAALTLWEDKITGLARKQLGVHFDTSCTDPSRLFYTARHAAKKAAEHCQCYIIRGEPLRFEDIPTMRKSEYTGSRVSGGNAFTQANDYHGDRPPEVTLPSGRFLNQWHSKIGKERFQIAEMLEIECADRVRGSGSQSGMVITECPFEHEHSKAGGSGTFAMNAIDSSSGYWTWKCHHDACQGRHKLEFLGEAIKEGWIEETVLDDNEYLLPSEDEDDDPLVIQDEETSGEGDIDQHKPIPCATWIRRTHGFERTGADIWTAKGGDDDDASSVPVCQTFKVVGDAMDDTRSSGAALMVEFKNRTGEKVEIALPRAEIVSESGGDIIKNLADAGFTFYGRGTHLKNNFLRLLNNISVERKITVSPRPGWQRDRLDRVLGFLLPTDEFIRAVPDQTVTTKLSPAGAFDDRGTRGTMEEWMDAADAAIWSADRENARHSNSNFHWTLGLCAAFVGPIIGLADLPPRGLNLSGDSSKGKSIALQLCTSVWGNPAPRASAFFPMNNTANAMEDLCTIGSETALCLDEIGALNNKRMLSDALFNVALGSGKGRKKGRDAGLAKGARYRPFVMLSNERTLRVEIESAGKRGDYRTGTSVRFPDISVTGAATVSREVIARLKKANANFGHAGPAFIRYLIKAEVVDDVEALKARVSAAEVKIARTAVPDGAEIPSGTMRASEVFALLLVAGELASDAGLIPDRDAVRDAVLEGFRRFMSSGEGEATRGEVSMLDGFQSSLTAAQGRGALVRADEAGEVGHTKRIGWFTEDLIILDAEAIKNVSDLGLSGTLDGLLKALDDSGALIRRTEKDRTHDRLPSEVVFSDKGEKPRRLRNYRIDRRKLDW